MFMKLMTLSSWVSQMGLLAFGWNSFSLCRTFDIPGPCALHATVTMKIPHVFLNVPKEKLPLSTEILEWTPLCIAMNHESLQSWVKKDLELKRISNFHTLDSRIMMTFSYCQKNNTTYIDDETNIWDNNSKVVSGFCVSRINGSWLQIDGNFW